MTGWIAPSGGGYSAKEKGNSGKTDKVKSSKDSGLNKVTAEKLTPPKSRGGASAPCKGAT